MAQLVSQKQEQSRGHSPLKIRRTSVNPPVPTSLYFQIDNSGKLCTRKVFLLYLEHRLKLSKRRVPVEMVTFSCKAHFIEASVRFPSIRKAKKSLRNLRKADTTITISMMGFNTDDLLAQILRVRRTFETRQLLYHQKHQEKIKIVKMELGNTDKKNMSLSEFQTKSGEVDALKSRKVELENQSNEFRRKCNEMCEELERLQKSIYTSHKPIKKRIASVQARFARECIRLQKALPIYARRTEIIDRISHSQVSIVIGETGSGKSTQLVQYLYDSGFADNGKIIACTQPRKVAASSLAEHVGGEICNRKLVSAKVTSSQKVLETSTTKIVYLTDHALLNECIQDKTFSKYSCVIIDEAHERSLHTDILLAFIKQCLPLRPDLKIIITSATIDPQLFVDYFGKGTPVVRVSGRTFPVEVAWCPLSKPAMELRYSNMPYVEEAIDCVIHIHSTEEEGAILVFLTSLFEIEVACNITQEKIDPSEVIILPLHGRLQPQEQKKVFQMYEAKRKIVFSTNIAETSITIPDVKYIVDSGFAKEMCFDPKRNMNSLEVRKISKSSAEQRKGRAGRVSAGKCFRLYSDEEYTTMPDRGLPEILRVHLTLAVLKLFEFGVSDVLSFDFVEMPNATSLKAAVDMLKFLGAYDEGAEQLSDTGRKLALFPVDPQLGKIILDAVREKLVLEAVVAVAISSVGGSIFYRGQTDEEKKKSDLQKLKFAHPGGDQLTSLNVYKEWVVIRKEQRNKWCVANSINAKSLRLVEETVKELFHILSTQLNVRHPPTNTPNIELAEKKLLKLFFHSFLWNLAIHLGHEKIGYMSLMKSTDEQLVLFPGSSLVQNGIVPQYLVYENTLKTTQQFLLQVLAVEKEWVDEAISDGRLCSELLQNIEKYRVKPFIISNLGAEVLVKGVLRKKKELIENMKAICKGNWRVELDCSIDKGTLTIYCCSEFAVVLKDYLTQRFDVIKNELKAQTHETGVTKPDDDVKLVLGSGGCIEYVLMPLDFHTLIAKGPVNEDGDWTKVVKEALLRYGEITFEVKAFSKEKRIFAKFKEPKNAKTALKNFSGLPEGVSLQPQLIRNRGNEGTKLFRLKIDWIRRQRKQFGFVEFKSEEDLDLASQALNINRPINLGYPLDSITFKPSKESHPNSHQLFVPVVPLSVTETQLKAAILPRLIPYGLGHHDFEIKFGREKSFETHGHQLRALETQLAQVILKYATKDQFRIDMQKPQNYHITYRSYVNFYDPEEGEKALNSIQADCIGGQPLQVELLLSSVTRLLPQVYRVVQSDLEDIENSMANVRLKIKNNQQHSHWIVEISSGDMEAFVAVKRRVNTLLQPRVFECRDSSFINEYILSKDFRSELDTIEKRTETVILQNYRNMTLCIYGRQPNCDSAQQSLQHKMDQLNSSGMKVHEIKLREAGTPPGVMRHLIQLFGVDLADIFDIQCIRRASINPRRQILTIFSNDEALHFIKTLIQEYGKAVPVMTSPSTQCSDNEESTECCACFTDIESVKEVFRLEYCGHIYHRDCIKLQLTPNTITIPVTCASDGCGLPFVWQDFQNLVKKKMFTLDQLVESSLRAYLPANKDKVHNCPTPDCNMVYKIPPESREGSRFICGCCGSHVCTKCHVQYHDGLSCRMYQSGKDVDKGLAKWLQEKPKRRKICPNCSTPIEKTRGCNKVTCKCNAHICWVCLKYFETEQDCYAHLGRDHGGFGEDGMN